jgi:hypothetical protein
MQSEEPRQKMAGAEHRDTRRLCLPGPDAGVLAML